MSKEEIKAYFDKNIRSILNEKINQAEETICLAVGWLTDEKLIEELVSKSKEGCKIRIIVSSDSKNFKIYKLGKLLDKAKLYAWVHFEYQINRVTKEDVPDDSFYLKSMHHKFCIIDGRILITGSANWSGNIDSNKENIIVTSNEVLIKQYLYEFNSLIDKSNKLKRGLLPSNKKLRKLKTEFDVQYRKRIKSITRFQKFGRLKEIETERIYASIENEKKSNKKKKKHKK